MTAQGGHPTFDLEDKFADKLMGAVFSGPISSLLAFMDVAHKHSTLGGSRSVFIYLDGGKKYNLFNFNFN